MIALDGIVAVLPPAYMSAPCSLLTSSSTMAYMDLIRGEMHSGFQSIKACARVIIRFPGICRYRFDFRVKARLRPALCCWRGTVVPIRVELRVPFGVVGLIW